MLRILMYMRVCACTSHHFLYTDKIASKRRLLSHTHTQTLKSVFVTINNYLPASTKLASNARFIHNLIFYCFHLIII